ncbi:MAG: hypothetical protein KGK34_01080 [Chloroflexota bacterium]|nr:hypothetical protein [Chloroflexota bacterium]
MDLTVLREPDLEFGGEQRHIDIRFGLMQSGPLDSGRPTAPRHIKVGLVGPPDELEGLSEWLERCRNELPPKESRFPNLFPRFPGCGPGGPLETELVIAPELTATTDSRAEREVLSLPRDADALESAIALFADRCDALDEKVRPDLFVCAPSDELLEAFDAEIPEGGADETVGDTPKGRSFHDVLKARLLRLRRPVQMVRPETYRSGERRRRRKRGRGAPVVVRRVQDAATRAWNLHVALYYKAGGTPWRVVRDAAAYATCYIGVSFYRSAEDDRLLTSMAQVFNERGEGVIVRGAYAKIDKDDRRPYLERDDAAALLRTALQTYRREHGNLPARIVVHKTSEHHALEREGFHAAAAEERIALVDLVSLFPASTRLFRAGYFPPLRGTLLSFSDQLELLYLRGSVPFYETYPGMYVPRPVGIRLDDVQSGGRHVAEEILALSKQNWNNTQFDGGWPITVRAARQVGDILKHLRPEDAMQAGYAFYM